MSGVDSLLYEFPCNEKIRTFLRLEVLFRRYHWFCEQESPIAHQTAISAIFDLLDATARSDLRNELIQELERQRQRLATAGSGFEEQLENVSRVISLVSSRVGKTGQSVRANQWLQLIRTRQTIAGGTCEFDLPQLHYWMNIPAEDRRAELIGYGETLEPIYQGVLLLLNILRSNPKAENLVAEKGTYQYSTRSHQNCGLALARVHLPLETPYIPEVSANKYMIWIRFSKPDEEHKLHPVRHTDIPFQLELCSLC